MPQPKQTRNQNPHKTQLGFDFARNTLEMRNPTRNHKLRILCCMSIACANATNKTNEKSKPQKTKLGFDFARNPLEIRNPTRNHKLRILCCMSVACANATNKKN
jgi:hypothetical protein